MYAIRSYYVVKRSIDLFISGTLILITIPVLIIIVFLLTVINRGRPFFFQARPGNRITSYNVCYTKLLRKYEDVIKEMLSAGIFILPSYTEGFPNVILESMTCGCPIIATSVGAIPEMLSEDSGVLVEPGNVEMLKEAINFLLNDRTLANIYGENAKKRVKDNYSIPIVWEKLEDIWLQN